jgi:SAM-dependent methyltransferase
MTMTRITEPDIAPVVWHDLECGSYSADLELWADLAERTATDRGSCNVLDLGCGTGRAALYLASRGHRVTGLDLDAGLAAELRRRAAAQNLGADAMTGDARDYDLGRRFDLVLAAMQFLQVLAGPAERVRTLACARAHLRPGGRFAAALMDLSGEATDGDYHPPLPDMCELDGWVWSSQAVEVRMLDGGTAIALDRHRRVVSPGGKIAASDSSVRLELLSPDTLEGELREAGLTPVERRPIPPTEDHVGSVVVIAERMRG